LSKLFKGQAEVLADPPSNCLLVSAPAEVFAEVVKLLEQLDRRPQLVAIDVLIAELAGPKGEAAPAADKLLDEHALTGPMDQVLARLEALRQKGLVGGLKRMHLSAAENQTALSMTGEERSITTAVAAVPAFRPGGAKAVTRNIDRRKLGTVVKVTPRVVAEQRILLDIEVEDSRAHTPEDGQVLAQDEDGKPVRATELVTVHVKTQLSLPSGQALAVRGVTTNAKSGQTQTLLIVGARLVELSGR
jgi:type II secretory pathway component GspD/PulD (secretin)